eukprot:m.238581 g.238581  ORF g.238581 m.238581 type:complete len:524 (+) comp13323_c0_seq1:1-1572(+)
MRSFTRTVLVLLAVSLAASKSPIKHVIVLMMENRSFDHFLGHLMKSNPNVDGLNGTQFNPEKPTDPSSKHVPVNYNAVDGGPDDPCHSFDCITQQIFGFDKPMNDSSAPVKMNGFVANALDVKGSPTFVMSAFNDTNLPILSTLATEFALFDHWHCSCPCPTNPNREFLMSGTAHGMTENTIPVQGFPQETHFAFLERHNISWKIYYNDDPWMAPTFADLRVPSRLALVQEMPNFFTDLKAGTLPQYSLIEPRMATSRSGPSNWQHPDNSVEQGEILMSQIYTALKSSQYWEDTLFIITYDEHGGFFDHQPTPATGVPAPDDIKSSNGFDYTRLGVRIPTVMISPWIPKGTLIHEPTGQRAPAATSQYDATSIISSVNKLFGITESMSRREAWAGTFHDLVDGSSPVRANCPDLPPVRALTGAEIEHEMNLFFNDHHMDSINLLCYLSNAAHPVCNGYATTPERERAQTAFTASLGLRGADREFDAEEWPHMHVPAATRLRQKHFGELSKFMFDRYKAEVMAQ